MRAAMIWLVGKFIYLLIRLLSITYSYKIEGKEHLDQARAMHKDGAYILAFWHEHAIMIASTLEGFDRFSPLVSKSTSGKAVKLVLEGFGFTPVSGSQDRDGKNKGGFAALTTLVKLTKQGYCPSLTVDGSIGPRRSVKSGVVNVARLSNCAILPAGASANRCWEFNTWDRLKLPKPFARIVLNFAEPVRVQRKLQAEALQAELTRIKELIDICEFSQAQNDPRLGQNPSSI